MIGSAISSNTRYKMSSKHRRCSLKGRFDFQWNHLVLLILATMLQAFDPACASSSKFIRMCYLQNQPIVYFTYDPTSKSYLSYTGKDTNDTSVPEDATEIYEARECTCRRGNYCLVQDGDACGIRYETFDVGCFQMNTKTIFVRNAWPIVVLWYAGEFR